VVAVDNRFALEKEKLAGITEALNSVQILIRNYTLHLILENTSGLWRTTVFYNRRRKNTGYSSSLRECKSFCEVESRLNYFS
jgi:hypothetical protein